MIYAEKMSGGNVTSPHLNNIAHAMVAVFKGAAFYESFMLVIHNEGEYLQINLLP